MANYLNSIKDTTFTKIFVGGLPYHTTNDTLREFFEKFGQIEEAAVINDRITGKSKGYGFVTMVDRAAAERAIADPNPIIDGRKANVNLAYLGAKPKTFSSLPTSLAPKPGVAAVLPGQASAAMVNPYGYPAMAASYGVHPGLLSLGGNASLLTTQALTSTAATSPEMTYPQLRSPVPTTTAAALQANQMLTMAAMGYDMSQYMNGLGGAAYMYSPATAAAPAAAYGQIQQQTVVPAAPAAATLPERA